MISIIVPVYNVENYLDECIQAILNQTCINFELILVDDGSTDDSGKICDLYAVKDKRVKVMHKKNAGVSAARNDGIRLAKGEYIMFCDSDDYVEDTWCEKLLKNIINEQTDLVICGANSIYCKQNKSSLNLFDNQIDKSILNKKQLFEIYSKWLLNTPWNKIFKARIIRDNNLFYDEQLCLGEDLLFNLSYIRCIKQDKIVLINKPLYNYCVRNNESLYHKYHDDLFEIQKRLYKEVFETCTLFNKNFIEYRDEFYSIYLRELIKVTNNTFNPINKKTRLAKLKYNNMVINSKEFKECLKNAQIEKFDSKYIRELRSGNYYWVYFMSKIHSLNNKIYIIINNFCSFWLKRYKV